MKATYLPTSTSSVPCRWPAFEFEPVTRTIFGADSLTRLAEAVQALGGSRVLLVTDPGLEAVGHPQRAAAILTEHGIQHHVFDGVIENPTEREVLAGVQAARSAKCDCIVAVGGGSTMDCAKGINFLLTNGGHMRDYRGHGKATKAMLPSVGVPTTAGTGSEAQSYALISDPDTHEKMACGDRKAAFRISILDPALTITQPRVVTAITGIDAMAHAIESFVCTRASPMSRMASRMAWRLLEGNFERVLSQPDDLDARAAMQLGAHLAGMAIENSMLGLAHSCANPLTARCGITHGVAVGLMLPHVVRFNGTQAAIEYDELAREVGLRGTNGLADRLTALLAVAGLPNQLQALHVPQAIIPNLAAEAAQQWTAQFNPRRADLEDLITLYQSAWTGSGAWGSEE